MRIAIVYRLIFAGLFPFAALTGCAGSQAGTPAGVAVGNAASSLAETIPRGTSILLGGSQALGSNRATGFISDDILHDATGAIAIFVSDPANNVIDIFNVGGKMTGQIAGFSQPQGIAVDTSGVLYVADTQNSRVLVYVKPYTKVTATLADPGQYPASVAVSPAGIVAVMNIFNGSVAFYAKGTTSPCATVTNRSFSSFYFGAFDDAGTLFVDGLGTNGSVPLASIAGGCKPGFPLSLVLPKPLGFPGPIAVTPSDDITIGDQQTNTIYTYAPPRGAFFGAPKYTTAIKGGGSIVSYALTADGRHLWTANAQRNSAAEYAYPKAGPAIRTFKTGTVGIAGVALNPAEAP